MGKNRKAAAFIVISLIFVIPGLSRASSTLFESYIAHVTGSYTEAVAIGDVNGDGRNDAVATTSSYMDTENDHQIHVFLQNERGKLDQPRKYRAGNGHSIDIGDISGDGKEDIVVSAENGIGVFLQLDDGRLAPMTIYPSNHESESNAYMVRIGDFNNDGLQDVVSIDSGDASSDVDIFFQRTDGTLSPPATFTLEHGGNNDLVVGDVNSDGLTDIIVMSGGGNQFDNIGILLQNSLGGFLLPYHYDLGKEDVTLGAALGDVDGDKLPDVVVSSLRAGSFASIGVLYQNDVGKLNPVVRFIPSPHVPNTLEIADVNFDGKDDVLVALCGKNLLGIYTQDGDGNLTLSQTLPLPYASSYNPHGLATGDINGDGAVDITLADPNHGMVVMYHAPPPEPLPDLIASWSEFSVDYADSTQKAEGYLQVANIGNREAVGVQIDYYLSEDDLLDGNDILVGKEIIRSLPPGKTIWPRFDYRAEIYLQGEFIIAVIDPENRLHESNESNNLTETPLAHLAENRNKVVEKKAFVRQACSSNFCSNYINNIKEYYH